MTKLPQWAQRRIEVLEQNAVASEARAMHATTPGLSNTMIHEYSGAPNSMIGLPPFSRIRFGDDDSWIEVHLCDPKARDASKVTDEGEAVIEVYSGTGRVSVHPNVSNSVLVKVESR